MGTAKHQMHTTKIGVTLTIALLLSFLLNLPPRAQSSSTLQTLAGGNTQVSITQSHVQSGRVDVLGQTKLRVIASKKWQVTAKVIPVSFPSQSQVRPNSLQIKDNKTGQFQSGGGPIQSGDSGTVDIGVDYRLNLLELGKAPSGQYSFVILYSLILSDSSGQPASSTSVVTFFNQSVFLTKLADFPAAAPISKGDIELGCKSLGSAKVNIDSTSSYSLVAQVTQAVVPSGAKASEGKAEDAFHLDSRVVCPSRGNLQGSKTAPIGSGDSTAGTSGKDYEIYVGVFFTPPGGYFSDAPSGTYSATITITVTD